MMSCVMTSLTCYALFMCRVSGSENVLKATEFVNIRNLVNHGYLKYELVEE